jgi:hypothetical protein
MSNTDNIVLDHLVELFLPPQRGVCRKPLPVDIRGAFFKDLEMDQQVYALYGLTPEEIRIVKEASA